MNDTKSVICYARRVALAKITSGAVRAIPAVKYMAFGDGGLGADGQPLEPQSTQTKLNHELGRYAAALSFPIETTARYTATIPEGDLEGAEINEMALVDADGVFCAIKNMYTKKKDAEVKFTFEFDDIF